ncbi:DUF2063 domain-containing protein [Rhodobacteraceae bacterium CCMM004]|nr:DUF2063 domain-containing protein [Rhodobacteraceae bacterium CCMM004]
MSQSAFTAALFDPARTVPRGLVDPQGRAAGKRFDVYRNNVAHSLIAALKTGFPALRTILGAENFRTLAALYVRRHPPSSPLMMHYGTQMPAMLEGFAPLAAHPHLPDLARLELALRESYHAADAAPADPARLAALTPARLAAARLRLAPALRLGRSRWPVLSLWRSALDPGVPAPAAATGEAWATTRPAFDPIPHALPPGGHTLIARLAAGDPIGAAHNAALSAAPGFDLAAVLGLLLSGGAIVDILEEPTP